jgi:SAM-dependent methyltransferase
MSRAFINNVRESFLKELVNDFAVVLDIGNQKKYDLSSHKFKTVTLDLSEDDHPDIVGDITKTNIHIPPNSFDAILCTEVLEHVVDPFAAVRELRRITKKGGYLLVTTPLNARIHGPIPDCWRFTEFGLKVLLRDWETVDFFKLDTPNRNLFPLHYGIIVKNINDSSVDSDPREMSFTPVE